MKKIYPSTGKKLPKGAKNNDYRVAMRRKMVAEMYLSGKSQYEIGKHLGVTQPCISGDLKVIQQAWIDSSLSDFSLARAKELAKIDFLEARAIGDLELSSQKIVFVQDEVTKEAKAVTKIVPGDQCYYSIIQKCIEMRVKILGLAPKETQTQVNNNFISLDWDKLAGKIDEPDPVEVRIESVKSLQSKDKNNLVRPEGGA